VDNCIKRQHRFALNESLLIRSKIREKHYDCRLRLRDFATAATGSLRRERLLVAGIAIAAEKNAERSVLIATADEGNSTARLPHRLRLKKRLHLLADFHGQLFIPEI